MSTSAVIMMIVMLGLFWGGFGVLLVSALRRDARRTDHEIPPPSDE